MRKPLHLVGQAFMLTLQLIAALTLPDKKKVRYLDLQAFYDTGYREVVFDDYLVRGPYDAILLSVRPSVLVVSRVFLLVTFLCTELFALGCIRQYTCPRPHLPRIACSGGCCPPCCFCCDIRAFLRSQTSWTQVTSIEDQFRSSWTASAFYTMCATT